MRILITGFDPFGGEKINPAWEAVNALPEKIDDVEIIKVQLPTVFKTSTLKLFESINQLKPDAVICVGQAGGQHALGQDGREGAEDVACAKVQPGRGGLGALAHLGDVVLRHAVGLPGQLIVQTLQIQFHVFSPFLFAHNCHGTSIIANIPCVR